MNGFYKTRRILLAYGCLSFAILLIGCSEDSNGHKRPRSQLVSVASVIHSPMSSVEVLPATLEANRRVDIFNQEDGLILDIKVFEGDIVQQGQLLVKLESRLVQAELQKAKISHRQAALELKRITKLRQRKLATEEALAQAQTKLELARAEESVLQTRFEYSLIKAPFNGTISQRLKEPGNIAAKYSHILTLVDTETLKAKVALSEFLLPSVRIGSPVTLQIDAVGATRYPAVISRIYPTIDKTTRQGTIEIRLENPPAQAKPGQLSRILLKLETTALLHAPLSAIKHNVNGSYVYKVIKNKAVLTQVTTGIQMGNRIQITSNLNAGDKLVTQGFLGLSNNSNVKIASNKNAAPKQ